MENKNDTVYDKTIMAMAILSKAMEQIDSILKDSNSQRIVHWKNNIYTVHEDMQHYLKEQNISE